MLKRLKLYGIHIFFRILTTPLHEEFIVLADLRQELTHLVHHLRHQLETIFRFDLEFTSAPIVAWMCNIPLYKEIMTDRPTNQQADNLIYPLQTNERIIIHIYINKQANPDWTILDLRPF